jgi:hypothetical protein
VLPPAEALPAVEIAKPVEADSAIHRAADNEAAGKAAPQRTEEEKVQLREAEDKLEELEQMLAAEMAKPDEITAAAAIAATNEVTMAPDAKALAEAVPAEGEAAATLAQKEKSQASGKIDTGPDHPQK